MRKTLLVPMAAAMLTTGCSLDLGMGDWSGFGGIGPCCTPAITMTPGWPDVLKGDTLRLATFFFPGSTDSTTWSVGDSAFRVVRMAGTQRDSMVLVAARRGSALVMASRGGASASVLLTAHDSSDVSAVRVVFPYAGIQIRQGQFELSTDARVLVGNAALGHRPTWSTSDTSKAIIALRAGPSFDPAPRSVIVSKGVGQVYIIAAWGALRDSVSVSITP